MEYGLWILAGLKVNENGLWLPEYDDRPALCASNDNALAVCAGWSHAPLS